MSAMTMTEVILHYIQYINYLGVHTDLLSNSD